MRELLKCVEDFLAHVTGNPQNGDLIREHKLKRINIEGDKIDNCSIEYTNNKDMWTRACKALLTNLSFLQTVCKLREEQQ